MPYPCFHLRKILRLGVGLAAAMLVSTFPSIARADEEEPSELRWFQTTRYRHIDAWELGAGVGLSLPALKGDHYDASMHAGPAAAIESAWRRELNPWLELAIGSRFGVARSEGIARLSPDSTADFGGAPRELRALTVSLPVRVTFGKAWPRDRGGFWKSPTRGMVGAAPMLAFDQLTLAHEGQVASRRVGGCFLAGFAQRTPSSKALDDVFVEGDFCVTTPSRAGDMDLHLAQAFLWVGYHTAWPVAFSRRAPRRLR